MSNVSSWRLWRLRLQRDEPQNLLEHLSWDGDLSHLKTNIAAGAHNLRTDLDLGEGDCKDYAIAKYLALLQAGFREQDVKLVIVHDVRADQDHAIVAVRFNGDWIVG